MYCLQVERIVDKRRNKKGKWEYLIRWKGYGSKEDTWEPENHLLHCEEFIDQFNSLRLHSHKRTKAPKSRQESLMSSHPSVADNSRARLEARKKKRTRGPDVRVREGSAPEIGSGGSGPNPKQKKVGVGPGTHALGINQAMTYKASPLGGPHYAPAMSTPHNGLQNGEAEPLTCRTAARSYFDGVDGELAAIDTTGKQFTNERGKKKNPLILLII